MIPIDDHLVSLVLGSPGQGKSTLLTRLAANGPPGTWLMSWDQHTGEMSDRMRRLGRTQGIMLFSAPLNVADLIESHRPPMAVLDAVDQMVFDRPTPRAVEVVKDIVETCRRVNTKLVFGIQRRRGNLGEPPDSTALSIRGAEGIITMSDAIWSFIDVLRVRCVKGVNQGFECGVDLIPKNDPYSTVDLDAGWLYIPTAWERLCED